MSIPSSLSRMVPWSHALLAPALHPGALAVDLTAGTGRDTLFLWEQVRPTGRVFGFDIQSQALATTRERLIAAGTPVHDLTAGERAEDPGVYLVHACHSRLDEYLSSPPHAIAGNLGFLPGGDPAVTTQVASTVAALESCCNKLATDGRLVLVVYPGHPEGEMESQAVLAWSAGLSSRKWTVLRMENQNRPTSPFLLVLEPVSGAESSKV